MDGGSGKGALVRFRAKVFLFLSDVRTSSESTRSIVERKCGDEASVLWSRGFFYEKTSFDILDFVFRTGCVIHSGRREIIC